MATRYRVVVERVDDVEGSAQYATNETLLFEVTHTNPERLVSFAPDEVRAALMEAFMYDGPDEAPVQYHEPAPEGTVESGDPAPAPAEDKPKRTRRTKAQIAEDRARELAEQVTTNDMDVRQVGEAADTVVEQLAAPATPEPVRPAGPAASPAAPYNPFAA
jgi:pyruvate/2-oxoglutarate dehydrogenase complex dihydrolipoamide acyltransferase (E2) component